MLRAEKLRYGVVGGEQSPYMYRVNDEAYFAVDMFLYEAGQKKPYVADDVKVGAFRMLKHALRCI